MGTQEWLLLGLVIVVPLVVAIGVTLWTLEQAIKRNRKNRPDRVARRVSEPVADTGVAATPGTTSHVSRDDDHHAPVAPAHDGLPAPDDPGSPGDSGTVSVGSISGDGGTSSDGGSSGDGGSSSD